ncbi:MAG: LysM peptidoglycan-binding domain-containing M23 family metallopeptidase [Methylobacteriaceae bacterium]|nr:LysM peptidoglycan-binding domain-containing M23 family metallopeptidase [Methylobacteriaceae bacterium]MBV9244028.1 LysM peptidoglycan-binding domain-containing M23 family metallopeptidase [Methylobacteriaceae bacterium]MBV9633678.1 LysM peptidoglycan-binding domain-containing M23 family metallopeptidase [Methylobacteriaceae bacterium]MBV9701961.1 LysM peptidoglycan-binding domain-containing M23 family metallopeptidase [Methylobacteriaceae bacterium]
MSKVCVLVSPRNASRVAVFGLAVALLGGCSSDVTRFSDPFSNPFATSRADQAPTGSVAGAPVAPVRSQPLGAPRAQTSAVGPRGPASNNVAGGAEGWSAAGGTPIVVAQGETVAILAERYGVPSAALLKSNGFSSAVEIKPGTRLIVPVYRAGAQVATRPANERLAKADVIERKRSSKQERVAEDNPPAKASRKTKVAANDKGTEAPAPKPKPPLAKSEPSMVAPPIKVASEPSRKAAPPAPAKPAPAKPTPPVETDPTPTASLPTASADAGPPKPEFRWPVRGRIIRGFPGNDGINIAVPEGTSVKAAEAGVVAYAGSELKGYGNMILIRHPNGFVSAYANNGELDVKRGDQVKRGQIIAKSGQSGNVSAPQLHFELRKGSTPVDPTQYLAGL